MFSIPCRYVVRRSMCGVGPKDQGHKHSAIDLPFGYPLPRCTPGTRYLLFDRSWKWRKHTASYDLWSCVKFGCSLSRKRANHHSFQNSWPGRKDGERTISIPNSVIARSQDPFTNWWSELGIALEATSHSKGEQVVVLRTESRAAGHFYRRNGTRLCRKKVDFVRKIPGWQLFPTCIFQVRWVLPWCWYQVVRRQAALPLFQSNAKWIARRPVSWNLDGLDPSVLHGLDKNHEMNIMTLGLLECKEILLELITTFFGS